MSESDQSMLSSIEVIARRRVAGFPRWAAIRQMIYFIVGLLKQRQFQSFLKKRARFWSLDAQPFVVFEKTTIENGQNYHLRITFGGEGDDDPVEASISFDNDRCECYTKFDHEPWNQNPNCIFEDHHLGISALYYTLPSSFEEFVHGVMRRIGREIREMRRFGEGRSRQ